MDSNKLCDPCDRTSKSSFAVKYCSDCEEFLCSECTVDHSKLKVFLSHHVVDVNVTDDKFFVVSKECPTHKDMTLDFCCPDHDNICCKSCIASMHRACENIKPLDVAAKGVIHSSMYEEFARDMVSLNDAATQFTDEWKKSKVAWVTSKDDVKRAVEKFKAKILKRINEIEEKLMHEIDSAKPGSKLDKSTVDKQVEEIQDVLKQFNFVTKHGFEDQIFRLMNTMKTNVPRMFNDMSILISSEASSRLVFEESTILSMIESLGSITVKRNPFDVKFNPHKIQQAQEMVQRIPSKIQLENSIPINVEGGVHITGEQHNLTRIDLSGCPWGIIVKEDEDEALVTLPEEEYIQVVNTATMTLARRIKCPDGGWGITLIDKDIALGRTGEVCIINEEGRHLRSITLDCDNLPSLYYGRERKLFCCDPTNDKHHCVNVDGTMVFSCSSDDFDYPTDVTVDVQGNSYVIGSVDDGLCCQLTVPCPKLPPVVQFRELEVAKKSVKLKEKLYNGCFSDVHAGKWRNTVVVAVKTFKQGGISAEDFLSEAKRMHKLRHRKLVQLLAVCTIDEPIWVITELMVNGRLLDYLRGDEGKTIKLPIIVDMAAQIADGMTYLETEKIVHRDLRAACILVGERNDVKVAEFGLARLMQEDIYEATGPTKFPPKWTAPEAALCGKFSIKSDVWSYGVLLYELITFGRVPYPGMTGRDVLSEVESGVRMDKPNGEPMPCPDPYYDIMLQCWKKMAASRPTFAFLHDFFDNYFVFSEESHREVGFN